MFPIVGIQCDYENEYYHSIGTVYLIRLLILPWFSIYSIDGCCLLLSVEINCHMDFTYSLLCSAAWQNVDACRIRSTFYSWSSLRWMPILPIKI